MKKILVVFSALMFVFLLSGCTPDQQHASETGNSPDVATLVPGTAAIGQTPTTTLEDSMTPALPSESSSTERNTEPDSLDNGDAIPTTSSEGNSVSTTNVYESDSAANPAEIEDTDEEIDDPVEIIVDNNIGVGGN